MFSILAINKNENLPKFCQIWYKILPKQNNARQNCQSFKNLPKCAKFRQIWSHCAKGLRVLMDPTKEDVTSCFTILAVRLIDRRDWLRRAFLLRGGRQGPLLDGVPLPLLARRMLQG